MKDGMETRLFDALRAAPEPAPDDVLQRILASRRAGVRAVLPVDGPLGDMRVAPRRVVRVAVAAAAVAVLAAGWYQLRPRPVERPVPANSALGFLFGGDVVLAQVAPGTAGTPPRYPPLVIDPARIHPVNLQYAWSQEQRFDSLKPPRTVQIDTEEISLVRMGDGRWEATEAIMYVAALPVWRHVDKVHFDARSLEVAQATLNLESSGAGVWPQEMTIDDSSAVWAGVKVEIYPHPARIDTFHFTLSRRAGYHRLTFLGMQSTIGRTEIVAMLMAVPFDTATRGSITMPAPSSPWVDPVFGTPHYDVAPVDLAVAGDTVVTVGGRQEPCWIVTSSAALDYRFIVRKQDGVMVSATREVESHGTMLRDEVRLVWP